METAQFHYDWILSVYQVPDIFQFISLELIIDGIRTDSLGVKMKDERSETKANYIITGGNISVSFLYIFLKITIIGNCKLNIRRKNLILQISTVFIRSYSVIGRHLVDYSVITARSERLYTMYRCFLRPRENMDILTILFRKLRNLFLE